MKSYTPNSVVTDNFLVYSALRTIAKEDNFAYLIWPQQFGSLKLVSDLVSLATLVELLVLHEEILVDHSTKRLWKCPALEGIIQPLDIYNRDGFLREAVSKVAKVRPLFAGDPAERKAVTPASETPVPEKQKARSGGGGTKAPGPGGGPSAPKVERPNTEELLRRMRKVDPDQAKRYRAREPKRDAGLLHHLAIESLPYESVILKIIGDYGGARDYDYAIATDFQEMIDHHDIKWSGFLLGAFYYDTVSTHLHLPYVPHPSRAHIIAYQMAVDAGELNSRSIATSLCELIRKASDAQIASVYEFFGHQVFEAVGPAIFSSIIGRAKTPQDVVKIALEYRESARGRALRGWISDLLLALNRGDIPTAERFVRQLRELQKDLGGEASAANIAQGFQISAGPFKVDPSVGAIGKGVSFLQNHRIRFLRFLTGEVTKLKSLNEAVGRVFGEDMRRALEAYPNALTLSPYETNFNNRRQPVNVNLT